MSTVPAAPKRSRAPLVLRISAIAIAAAVNVVVDMLSPVANSISEAASYLFILACIAIAGSITNRESRRFIAAGIPYGLEARGRLDVSLSPAEAMWAAGEALSAIGAYDVDIDWSALTATANGPANLRSGGRQLFVRVAVAGDQGVEITVVTRPRLVVSSRARRDRSAQPLVDKYIAECRRNATVAGLTSTGT